MIHYDRPLKLKVEKPNGYLYFIDKQHPLASPVGRVYHHRHVVSLREGRWLRSDEIVHHRDEDKANNSEDNLEITTRSAHSLEHALERGCKPRVDKACPTCFELFRPWNKSTQFCSRACVPNACPPEEVLRDLIFKLPTEHIAKLYGVSGVAVQKWCKKLGISKPGRGYWAKLRSRSSAE
jgi:hypothetical protein